MDKKLYKRSNSPHFYLDSLATKPYFGAIEANGTLYWAGRDGSRTYMRPINYFPSDQIINKLKEFEGWHQGWVDDGAGNLTTGWGFKITPELKKKYPNGMTRQQADDYLMRIAIPERVKRLKALTPRFNSYNQNQLDALFDYFYNIGEGAYSKGSPSLQNALKERNIEQIVNNIDFDYNDSSLPGARKRRNYERNLFLTPMQKPEIRLNGGKLLPRLSKMPKGLNGLKTEEQHDPIHVNNPTRRFEGIIQYKQD